MRVFYFFVNSRQRWSSNRRKSCFAMNIYSKINSSIFNNPIEDKKMVDEEKMLGETVSVSRAIRATCTGGVDRVPERVLVECQ